MDFSQRLFISLSDLLFDFYNHQVGHTFLCRRQLTIHKHVANNMKKILDSRKYNLIGIFVGTIIAWIIAMRTDLPDSSNHGGFIPLIYPPFIGILTVVGYLISRLITQKYNWIISIIGIVYILHFAIDFNLSYA